MFRMASLSLEVGFEEKVSRVQRVSSVGVTDESSLAGVAVGVFATVLLLTAGLGLFGQGRIVVTILFVLVLFH